MSGSDICAESDGVVARVNLEQGAKLEKGGVAAVLYPEGAMRVEAQLEEANLSAVSVGEAVSVELIWNQDDEVNYPGKISMISAVATETGEANADSDGAVTYTVYVDFTPDENTRYGMSAVVTTLDEVAEEASEDEME